MIPKGVGPKSVRKRFELTIWCDGDPHCLTPASYKVEDEFNILNVCVQHVDMDANTTKIVQNKDALKKWPWHARPFSRTKKCPNCKGTGHL